MKLSFEDGIIPVVFYRSKSIIKKKITFFLFEIVATLHQIQLKNKSRIRVLNTKENKKNLRKKSLQRIMNGKIINQIK